MSKRCFPNKSFSHEKLPVEDVKLNGCSRNFDCWGSQIKLNNILIIPYTTNLIVKHCCITQ